jgi:hypothetical protein
MIAKSLHVQSRFFVAALADSLVFFCIMVLASWSSVEREIRWNLLEGSAAAVAVVFLTPVLIHGDAVQRILAAILLILPVIGLLCPIFTAAGYLFDFYIRL